MKSGGELQSHIYEKGWLSGSVYINIPANLKANSGNLVVSLDGIKGTADKCIHTEKIINVATGSLVLFPASLMHYTIPFEAEDERIVLAFDVIRKWLYKKVLINYRHGFKIKQNKKKLIKIP